MECKNNFQRFFAKSMVSRICQNIHKRDR